MCCRPRFESYLWIGVKSTRFQEKHSHSMDGTRLSRNGAQRRDANAKDRHSGFATPGCCCWFECPYVMDCLDSVWISICIISRVHILHTCSAAGLLIISYSAGEDLIHITLEELNAIPLRSPNLLAVGNQQSPQSVSSIGIFQLTQLISDQAFI